MDDADTVFALVLDSIVAYVTDGISVHLVGPRGSGRSEILRRAADRLDDSGSRVFRLYGNAAWRDEPYGVLATAGIAATEPRRRLAEETVTALAHQLRGASIVVCDDADEFDQASVGTLLAAHRQRPLVVLTSSRQNSGIDAASLMLGIKPAVRIRVPALDGDQVHDLVQRVLGAPVDAGTLARIAMTSGGLYGLAAAIVSIGRRTGMLVQRNGVWTAPGELWTEHLAAVVEPLLADVDAAVLDAATSLAVIGPMPLELAEKLTEQAELRRLFVNGLVHHFTHENRTLVGIYPPLLAEYLRREGSGFELARAADGMERVVGLGVPDPIAGADAAMRSLTIDRKSAERAEAARVLWSAAPTPEHASALITALRYAGAHSAEIAEVIELTRSDGPDDPVAAALYARAVATWRAVGRNDLPEALTVLDAAIAAHPDQAPLLRGTRDHLVFLRDRAPEIGPDTNPMVAIEVLLASGQVEEGRSRLVGFAPAEGEPNGVDYMSGYAGLADILVGDIELGIENAHRQLNIASREGDDLSRIVGNAYVAVFGLMLAGRLADAAAVVNRTLSAPRVASYHELLHTGLLVWGAEIAISQGQFARGRTLAAQALASDRGTGPFPGQVPAILAGLDPDAPADLPAKLWPLVLDRLERGYAVSAVTVSIEAVERGVDAKAATRVAKAAARMQGRLLPAAGKYIRAVAERDPDLLATARDEFNATGAMFYSVRASVSRALLLRQLGRPGEATAEAEDAWRRSAAAGLDRTGLFHRLIVDVALSDRELEVLRMIARPMTATDVAQAFQMSVRTVETHLHNVNRKLGTAGRDEMTTAATTWLSGA